MGLVSSVGGFATIGESRLALPVDSVRGAVLWTTVPAGLVTRGFGVAAVPSLSRSSDRGIVQGARKQGKGET